MFERGSILTKYPIKNRAIIIKGLLSKKEAKKKRKRTQAKKNSSSSHTFAAPGPQMNKIFENT